MVDYYIYAKDCSDSINKAEYYYSNHLKTLEQFKYDVERIKEQSNDQLPTRQFKILYLHWSDVCWEVNENKVELKNHTSDNVSGLSNVCISERRDPGCLIRHLRKNYTIFENDRIKLLHIVTNGMISRERIDECLELNKDIDYETVVLHAFEEDSEKIDLSVAAPFFKGRCFVYYNNELCDSTDISKEFDYDKINSDNFAVEMQQLGSYIKLKFINKFKRDADVWREIEKLVNLRNRMLRELSENTPKCPFFERMEEKERKILMRTFDVNKYKNYISMAYVMKTDAEKYVAALVDYIKSNRKSCSLHVLKFDSKVSESAEEKQIYDADSTDDEECDLVLMDDEDSCLDNLSLSGDSSKRLTTKSQNAASNLQA
ncbi:p94 protein [Danaus plexippus plexippus]|uniref:P94 protein n=1 Tax=Danaus plexippus plexippus TaxID=278856 RepID=A0A212FIP0_DANPL|nr:p94 protein [Danaus plexippus plexippus]